MFQSKESIAERGSGNVFGVPLHPRALGEVPAHRFERKADKGIGSGTVFTRDAYLLPPELRVRRAQPGEVPQPLLSFRISVLPL